MNIEFKKAVREKLDSISDLAVSSAPISQRLQVLASLVCDLFQAPAIGLFLNSELCLSPPALLTGENNEAIQALSAWETQNRDWVQGGKISLVVSSQLTQSVTDERGQAFEIILVPVVVGNQRLGIIAVASSSAKEIQDLDFLHQLISQTGMLLLLLHNVVEEGKTPPKDTWFTEEFLAMLSHELRAPLHAILGWVSVLQHPATAQETWKHALKTIERSARAQSQIINDLLDASFFFNQQLQLETRSVRLHSILQQVVKSLLPAAEQKEILLTTNLQLEGDYLMADAERLRQAFWHLLSNAIKFTPRKGQIQMLTERVGEALEFTLVDSGIGIGADFLPHSFEPFRQESARTTRKFGGLGLGLAIAKHQIELHGGNITIASAGKNQGATVVVRLPLATTVNDVQPETFKPNYSLGRIAAATKKNLDGLRVLVVDDDADSLEIVSTILQNCNSEVQTAINAQEALHVLQHWEPDVLISDLQMPGMDGYELMRRIRREKPSFRRRLGSIALTAYARAEDRVKVLASGFNTHLAKPIDPKELVAVVKSLATQSGQTYSLT